MRLLRSFIALPAIAAALAGAVPVIAQVSATTRLNNAIPIRFATPSPSPAPPGAVTSVRYNAATAAGVKLTTLRGVGATSIIIVGGKPKTLTDLRAQLRTATLAALGPRQSHTRSGSLPAGSLNGLGKPAGGKKTSFDADSASALAIAGPKLGATQRTFALAGATKESVLAPGYCNTHAPIVTGVKGSVTSAGYLVVEGACFGTGGTIKLLGKFDGGALVLASQNWDAGSITASIPKIAGVYDQTVTLEISRDTFVSNDRTLNFVAARETIPLPGHFITATTCDQTYIQAQCVDGTGFRLELGATFAGTDGWHAAAPPGWVLNSLTWSSGIGTVTYNGDFDAGPPSDASWTMSWNAGVARTVSTTQTILGFHVDTDTTDFYGSTYGMTVYATGPVGTMPS